MRQSSYKLFQHSCHLHLTFRFCSSTYFSLWTPLFLQFIITFFCRFVVSVPPLTIAFRFRFFYSSSKTLFYFIEILCLYSFIEKYQGCHTAFILRLCDSPFSIRFTFDAYTERKCLPLQS